MMIRTSSVAKQICTCYPSSPFLATILVNQGGMSVPDLIIATMGRICSYDTEHPGNTVFEKVDTHCRALVHWPFAANDKTVGAIYTTPSNDNVIIAKGRVIHKETILTPDTTLAHAHSTSNSEVISQLASNVNEKTGVI